MTAVGTITGLVPPTHLGCALARAGDLALAHGHNATAYQILNPGISHWFAGGFAAVVGYVKRGGYLVVAGAPVCPPALLVDASRAFEEFARRQGCHVCYVCAEEAQVGALRSLGNHASICLGAMPVWNPRSWAEMIATNRGLRGQLNRARNKRVEVEEVHAARHARDPRLRTLLADWLDRHPLFEMGFLAGARALNGSMRGRLLFVARRDGRPVGFLLASPVAARNGFLAEQIVRDSAAPNGTTELLIDMCMRILAERGFTFCTLGLVALSRQTPAMRDNPLWVNGLFTAARLTGERLYHFDGLERFRLKLAPAAWEPVHIVVNSRRFAPGTLPAAARAFYAPSLLPLALRLIGAHGRFR